MNPARDTRMIKKFRLNNFTGSIFTKLLLIILICGMLINLFVGAFFRRQFDHNRRNALTINSQRYAEYLINDIGIPPDLNKAKTISEETLFSIAIKGPKLNWSTSGFNADNIDKKHLHQIGASYIGLQKGNFTYIAEKNGYKYIFSNMNGLHAGNHFYFLLITLSIVLVAAYLAIRRILTPVKLLSEGIKETAKGNFNSAIPVKNRDELGRLTSSFNDMNQQIKNMLSLKEQLLLDVSHELRSPLTRIKVALEFIRDDKAKESINEDILNIEAMISEILETSRLNHNRGRLKLERISPQAFINKFLETFNNKHEIILNPAKDKINILADKERLTTILKNILENSLKYSKSSSTPIEISIDRKEDTVEITIKDYGDGIPESDLPFVFEPFYRVDRSRSKQTGGYGLGLSLCKKIMEAHGGKISITSNPGSGTAVILSFPQVDNE
jgi:signal transduction histidine kinase